LREKPLGVSRPWPPPHRTKGAAADVAITHAQGQTKGTVVDRHHTRPKAIADVTIAHAQGQAVDRLFCFLTLFRKIFTSRPFLERFQKMDPELGAVDHGAEVTNFFTKEFQSRVTDIVFRPKTSAP
jgi:hypothetical protein